jgi:hypothetical protein
MNRRVLLIDADTEFRDTLTRELGRYKGVVVMTEADADRAFAIAAAEAPSLIVIAVEEPEKTGYKVFQKSKKGALSKVPIMLVTHSVSADSFAKHRGLKVHADEYVDKRTMSTHELVGKIDGLIGLGEPSDSLGDISVDDLAMDGASDVVEETIGGDDAVDEFDAHEARTVGPGQGGSQLDKLMDLETDAAFASLLGDEPPAVGPEADAGAIPEPVPHVLDDDHEPAPPPEDAAPKSVMSDADMQSVPLPVHDGGHEPSERFGSRAQVLDNFESESAVHEFDHEVPVSQIDTRVGSPLTLESSPSIPIEDEELVPLDEDIPLEEISEDEAAEVEARPKEATIPPPIDLSRAPSEPVITSAPRPEPAPERAARDTGGPRLVETAPREVHEAATVMAAPVITEEARSPSHSSPRIDLGLDAVAQDADREQSGVYDRKSLRKIGELERQIGQLKSELERAKAAAETAAKGAGRENQFLNLREQNLAKDKELKQLRAEFEAQGKQVADLQTRLDQAQHAKTTLETKNGQLEERLLESGDLAKAVKASDDKVATLTADKSGLEAKLADHAARLAQAERDATEKHTAAEAARKALEQELAAAHVSFEDQLEAANASREQQVAAANASREQQVAAANASRDQQVAEANASREQQVAAANASLEQQLAAATASHEQELAAAHASREEQLATAQASHEQALAAAQAKHRHELDSTRAGGDQAAAAAVAAARTEADQALAKLRAEAQAALDAALNQQAEELGTAHAAALDEAVEEVRRANATEHQDVVAGLEKRHASAMVALKADLAEARTTGDRAVADARAAHAAEVEQLTAKHAAAIDSLQEEHQEQRDRDSESQASAIATMKQELDRTTASHEVKLAAAKREIDGLIAQHEANKGELKAQHQDALAAMAQEREQQLAGAQAEREQIEDAARRAADAHKAALSDARSKHDGEVAHIQETAQREVSDAKSAMLALKKTADEMIGKLQAERSELEKSHAQAAADAEAKHDRALALANGDFLKQKGVADAEHGKQIATLEALHAKVKSDLAAEHARAHGEVSAERDELKRGLSSARDSIKRSEGELASAVQTIADRNADLRAHAAAIAERDTRIAELRKDIEALEQENASYQEQVLRAYQKIKADEAMVARARKAMAIALTVLDDQGNPSGDKPPTS